MNRIVSHVSIITLNVSVLNAPLKRYRMGQVQWLTPVIPALKESEVGRSPEVRSLRSDWLT